jgi:hypothetical protein
MLTINFFFPGNPYEHTYSFTISKTFYDMIELLKDKIYQNNNRDIILTLNGKELKYDNNTLLSNCGIKNNDNIYVRYDDFIDINFVYPNLISGIELVFNKTDTFNHIIKAIKQEMDCDKHITLTFNNKLLNYSINDVITSCGIKNNDIIYVNYL